MAEETTYPLWEHRNWFDDKKQLVVTVHTITNGRVTYSFAHPDTNQPTYRELSATRFFTSGRFLPLETHNLIKELQTLLAEHKGA